MIVVSDTSAITSLVQIGQERALQVLFEQVVIPTAVRDELLRFHKQLPEFLEVAAVRDANAVNDLLTEVDQGEAEAIVLCAERKADFVLIDDLAARHLAIERGLPVIGLVGVLIRAKRERAIASLAQVLEDLEQTAGFRIGPTLKAEALRLVGE
jgi:uncharacterized protein